MSDKDVRVIRGEVLDSSRLNQTEVWSSGGGGGGYVGPHGGNVNVSAPTVHSRTTTNTDVFIKDAKGKEHAVRFHDLDIPVRAGHDLELAYVKIGDSWYLVGVVNHTLERHWLIPCNVRTSSEQLLWLFWSLASIAALLIAIGGLLTSCMASGITAAKGFKVAIGSGVGLFLANTVTLHYEHGPARRAAEKAKKALRINNVNARS